MNQCLSDLQAPTESAHCAQRKWGGGGCRDHLKMADYNTVKPKEAGCSKDENGTSDDEKR